MVPIKNKYDEIFAIEIEGWCYGLQNYPGEIYSGIVFRVVAEMSVCFKAAIQNNVVFDIIDVATQISKAAKYLVPEKEIAFCILANTPSPYSLDEDSQFVLAQVADQVEQTYGGALARLEKRWKWEREQNRNTEPTAA